jgi:hypothetical protein
MNPLNTKSEYTLDEVLEMYGAKNPTPQPSIQAAQQTSKVPFPATGQEGGLEAGLKAAGNLPASAFNLGKNIF